MVFALMVVFRPVVEGGAESTDFRSVSLLRLSLNVVFTGRRFPERLAVLLTALLPLVVSGGCLMNLFFLESVDLALSFCE